jgi:hypothetical protein
MTFHRDLEFASVYERRIPELFENKKHWFSPRGSKEYDVGITNGDDDDILFEVKADRRTKHTGNVAIEFRCRGKDSGITTTGSDYWVYFIDGTERYYVIPTQNIRDAIDQKKWSRTVRGGDDYVAEMYLFSEGVFSEFLG